jgi:hypothetical protein
VYAPSWAAPPVVDVSSLLGWDGLTTSPFERGHPWNVEEPCGVALAQAEPLAIAAHHLRVGGERGHVRGFEYQLFTEKKGSPSPRCFRHRR